MRTIKLNSYRPLCWNMLGVEAIRAYSLKPFIDASCRREPDFENPFPSISALCRQGVFAPHIRLGDITVYMTVGGRYPPYKKGYHLVAILQAEQVFSSHARARDWYMDNGYPIPSNCMVPDNPPFPFEQTAGDLSVREQRKYLAYDAMTRARFGSRRIMDWNRHYSDKACIWPSFIRNRALYLDLTSPPEITLEDFQRIFGGIPATRTPKKITLEQLKSLAAIAGVVFT